MLAEGWYLMSTSDLERELARWREPAARIPPSNAVRLSIEDARSYRDSGNLPDEAGRSLRLVLHIDKTEDLTFLQQKRLIYEPDFHDAPEWRREGSKPVNVVPLRAPKVMAQPPGSWWEGADVAALEDEWAVTGQVAGLVVPGEYRGFIYKTVLALRSVGRAITADSIADSIARWVPEGEARRIREALRAANR